MNERGRYRAIMTEITCQAGDAAKDDLASTELMDVADGGFGEADQVVDVLFLCVLRGPERHVERICGFVVTIFGT